MKSLVIALSSISALLTIVGFACNPRKDKTNYRMAFQVLNEALIKHGNEDSSTAEIVCAIKIGERIIGRTYDVDEDTNT